MRQRQQAAPGIRRVARVVATFVVAALVVGSAAPARADSDDEAPVFAVQNRKFNLKHEFDLGVGTLPINAYTKGVTLGVAYTYHFSPMWAWEVARFVYSFGVATSLRNELVQDFMAEPTRLQAINYFASSSVVVKPLYGKLAFSNRRVVHMEVFFALGLGVGFYTNAAASPTALSGGGLGTPRPGFDVGGGLRFFLSERWSLRLDVRDLTYFKSFTQTDSDMYIGLAAAVTFGSAGR